MSELEVELVEPVREVVEVIEPDGTRTVYVVEPTAPQAVPRVLSDLDDVAATAGFDGQVLTLVDGVWTPVNPGGVSGGITLAEVDALFPRTTEVAADLAAGLAGKSDIGHTHAIGDVTGLQTALNGKETAGAAVAAVAVHAAAADPHPQYLTTARGDARYTTPDALDDYVTLTEFGTVTTSLADKAPLVHGHAISDVTGLQAALDGKQAADAALTSIAALAPADGSVLARVAGAWSSRTGAQLKGDLALTKADVGLGNVDNTADLAKPVSTATQAALDAKAPAASPTFTGTVTAARVVSPPVALVDAATIATDAALGNNFRVTLGGNRTLGAPTNPVDGQRCTWLLTQDGTGNRTITLAAGAGGFAFGSDITAFALSTAAGKSDMLGAEYHAGRDRWLVLATAKGY